MRLTRTCVAFAVVLSLSTWSLAGSADLAWIGAIPGLKAQVASTGPSGQGVYTFTSEPGAVFDALRAGFARNGWSVEKSTNVGMAGLRTLVAVKQGQRAKAVLSGDSLIVSLTPVGAAVPAVPAVPAEPPVPAAGAPAVPPPPAAPPAPAAPAVPAVAAKRAGPRLEVSQNETKGAWLCEDTYVTVRGRGNDITLEGHCREIAVHGMANRIDVRGRVSAIETHGRDNVVNWSTAANPSAPRQEIHGQGNRIIKVD